MTALFVLMLVLLVGSTVSLSVGPTRVLHTRRTSLTSGPSIQRLASTAAATTVQSSGAAVVSSSSRRARSSFALHAASEKDDAGVEPKYLVALGVFFLACVYDFFVMHNGVPIWEVKDAVLID